MDQIQTAVSIQLQSENGLHLFQGFKIKRGVGEENIIWYVKAYAIPMLEIINKVLLEERQGHFVYIYGCFRLATEMTSFEKDRRAHKVSKTCKFAEPGLEHHVYSHFRACLH